MKKNSLLLRVSAFIYLILLVSCSPSKENVVYFDKIPSNTQISSLVDNEFELKIRKNDLLNISIISPDPVTTPLFNNLQNASTSNETSGVTPGNNGGYLVDNQGNITIYKLGNIHVEGLTRMQLKDKIQRDISPYLKDAVITVRFLSNRVTVLGEVGRPQVIVMQTEKVSLLEVIAISGDITMSGRKDNILVIRETPTGKEMKRLNLTDKSIFNSPYYYLKPDDVIYVEPTEAKIKSTTQNQQIIGYVLTGFSILITLISLLIR